MTREEFEAVLALDGFDLIIEESVYHKDDPYRTDKVVFAGLRKKKHDYDWYGVHAMDEGTAVMQLQEYWETDGFNHK
ncbi:hypothetical protein D3C87_658040 [compost metagenome]